MKPSPAVYERFITNALTASATYIQYRQYLARLIKEWRNAQAQDRARASAH